MIEKSVLDILEYNKILGFLSGHTHSEASRVSALEIKPQETYNKCLYEINLTREADLVVSKHLKQPITRFDDVYKELQKTSVSSILSFGELLKIARLLSSSRICKKNLEEVPSNEIPLLFQLSDNISVHRTLEDDIFKCIVSEEEMADNASPDLKNIRRQIAKCNQDIKQKLQSYIKSQTMQKYMQDAIITERNGRYVIPVKTEYKNLVDGLVHDQSASKATVFIEPMQIVTLNNDLKTLEIEEMQEIQRILQLFTDSINRIQEQVQQNYYILLKLDVVFAKIELAKAMRAKDFVFNEDGKIKLKNARHPLIDKNKVVPLTIELGNNFDVLIITGPNTGGKTVATKTCGLLTLMSMSGLYVPCEEGSELSFFENIFCDIGDNQSIENSLSTFSSHISNIKKVCELANSSSLVLLDEIGGGTDPEEGVALAIAIIEHLAKVGAKVITTTHYGALKEYSIATERIENASMEFDINTLLPTYRLNIGVTGSSKALEIALMLGLHKDIVDNAKKNLSKEKIAFESVMKKADEVMFATRQEVENAKALKLQLEKELEEVAKDRKALNEKMEKISMNAKAEARRMISGNLEEAEYILDEIKKITSNGDITHGNVLEASKLKKQLENELLKVNAATAVVNETVKTSEFVEAEAKIGDAVFIKSLNCVGEIIEINPKKKEFKISSGALTVNVKKNDLLKVAKSSVNIEKKKNKYDKSKNDSGVGLGIKAQVQLEINLLGQNSLEAEMNAEEFVEQAAQNGATYVKIIHGIGTGKLRQTIHAMLKKNCLVDSFRLGKYGEGENGVTIVTLK